MIVSMRRRQWFRQDLVDLPTVAGGKVGFYCGRRDGQPIGVVTERDSGLS